MQLTIATEDELSEAVLERVIAQTDRFEVVQKLRRGGFGYLKKLVPGLNKAAAGHLYLIMVDLDRAACAPDLIAGYFGRLRRHANLQFRVAVRAVESWLLADSLFVTDFLGLSAAHCPNNPDALDNPKQELIRLATRSRRSVRRDLVPQAGTSATQGPNYNAPLVEFVRTSWNLRAARQRSGSLERCLTRLTQWHPILP